MTTLLREPIQITIQDRQALLDVAMKIRAFIQHKDCDRLAGGFMEYGVLLFNDIVKSDPLKQKCFALLEALSDRLEPENWKQYAAKYATPVNPVTLGLGHLVLDAMPRARILIEDPNFVPVLPVRFLRD